MFLELSFLTETLKKQEQFYYSCGFYVPGSLAIGVIPGFDTISVPRNIVARIRWWTASIKDPAQGKCLTNDRN